jgi:hypothetical protein
MPCTPADFSASFTSSTLKGLMIVVINFTDFDSFIFGHRGDDLTLLLQLESPYAGEISQLSPLCFGNVAIVLDCELRVNAILARTGGR